MIELLEKERGPEWPQPAYCDTFKPQNPLVIAPIFYFRFLLWNPFLWFTTEHISVLGNFLTIAVTPKPRHNRAKDQASEEIDADGLDDNHAASPLCRACSLAARSSSADDCASLMMVGQYR